MVRYLCKCHLYGVVDVRGVSGNMQSLKRESKGTEAPLAEGQSQNTGLARSPFLSEGQQCAHTFH